MNKILLSLTFFFICLFSFSQTGGVGDFALRINTGGSEVVYNGETFVTDTFFDTGRTLDRPQTGLPEPYQSFRYSRSQQMRYDIPLEDGEYIVNLYFAELWFGATGGGTGGVGSRVFDVTLEGQVAEDNLDVFAQVGADAMLMKTHTVTVTGGVLDIDFDSTDAVGGERHPIINAIEILSTEPEEPRPFIFSLVRESSFYETITIPVNDGETYDYTVDWGDGSVYTGLTGPASHTYSNSNQEYKIKISGQFPSVYFGQLVPVGEYDSKLTIYQWGDQKWSSFRDAFGLEITKIVIAAEDTPDLSQAPSLSGMFAYAFDLDGSASMHLWDVSGIEDMSSMFWRSDTINADISAWDVSNVKNMSSMFAESSFNQDISAWDVSKVLTMNSMFNGAINFNQDISSWDLSQVGNIQEMFADAVNFDQNLASWNVSNVVLANDLFVNSKLSNDNYDALLIGWGAQQLKNDVVFGAGTSQYCQGEAARQKLIDDFGWTITDGGKTADCPDTTSFITTWKTDNPGISNDNQITIHISRSTTVGPYDYSVNWGDGTTDHNLTGDSTHTYDSAGTYVIAISGDFPAISFGIINGEQKDNLKLLEVNQWGSQTWSSLWAAFDDCENLDIVATDVPDLSAVTSLGFTFRGCEALVYNSSVNDWDVSTITNMDNLFSECSLFDQDISGWNVGQVTNMEGLFSFSGFNQDIANWNVGEVRQMDHMFFDSPFNKDIGGWNVAKVTHMSNMFRATPFNQDIGNWDVGQVIDMSGLFASNAAFDQDLSAWNVAGVSDMTNLFEGATLSLENYDALLNAWSGLQLQNDVVFHGGYSQYCQSAVARQELIDDFGWTITDGGKTADCPDTTSFITTWKTDTANTANDDQITIPTFESETYNYIVDWGDGSSDSGVTGDITHTYATPGNYQVSISGQFPRIYFQPTIDDNFSKLLFVNQWGTIAWTSMEGAFSSCYSLDVIAEDTPDLSNASSLAWMFSDCFNLHGNATFAEWDVSNVTDMSAMFLVSTFNQDIGNWDVSKVQNMRDMFNMSTFNHDISNWDVSNVTNMISMFEHSLFNQSLGNWDVSNVTNMSYMLSTAEPIYENYDSTLIGWNTQQLQPGVLFDAGMNTYCLGEAARQKLIDDFGWTITDGGKASDCPEPINFALRVNAGGSEITYNDEIFITDTYFNTGTTLDRPQTGLPEPFQTFRFSRSQQMGYDIPLEDGEYTVNLYFAELWFGATGGGSGGAGSRVFDVSIEGQLAEDNLDVFAEAGADAMLMKSHTITVTDGILDIDFDSRDAVGGERHPIINAIEILGSGIQNTPITIAPISDQSNDINDVVSIEVLASGGAANTPFSYSISGQPLGANINETTGMITGTIDPSAAMGGPNADGVYQATVVVSKAGSTDASTTFEWTITDPDCTWNDLVDANINRFEGISQKIDDKMYIFGGFTHGVLVVPETEIYDATNDSYTFGESMPIPSTHIAAVAMDNEIWIIGGFVGDNPGPATDAVQVYDVINDSWTMGPSLPTAIGSGAGARIGNKIHFFGGLMADRQTDVDNHWVLDLDNIAAGWVALAPMPEARNHHSGIALNGLVYAIGGQTGHDGAHSDTKFVHAYDPLTDQWTRLPDLARPRSHFKASTTLHNGKIIIVGGVDNGPLVNDISQFDPLSNAWSELCKLPGEGLEEGAAQAFGNRLIVSGGRPVRDANIMLKTTRWLPLDEATTQPPVANAGLDQHIELPENSVVINGSGVDPDGGLVTFRWTQISGPNTAEIADSNGNILDASGLQIGTYVFRLTVTDDENETDFDEVQVVVESEPTEPDFALRINSGGTEVGYNGEIFITDTYFDTGSTLDRPQTGLPEPFQTFRFSRSQQMGYDIPLEDGEYTVNLYFAELWFGATGGGTGGVGSRVFDVSIEGQLAEDNLDVFAEVGADAMLMKSHAVTVVGGVLDIDFDSRDVVGGERHPIINAIEILGLPPRELIAPRANINLINIPSTTSPAPFEVEYLSASIDDIGIVSHLWDFGDGFGDEGERVFHTYTIPGDYVITLLVTDTDGLTDSSTFDITVTVPGQTPPQVRSGLDKGYGIAPMEVNFTSGNTISENGIASYLWDFGDGNTSTEANPTHVYAEAGEYVTFLTVTDNVGLVGEGTRYGLRVVDPSDEIYFIEMIDVSTNAVMVNVPEIISGFPLSWNDNGISMRALVNEETVESVKFELSGPLNFTQVENMADYMLFGKEGDNYFTQYFPEGDYILTVTTYDQNDAQGTPTATRTVRFDFTDYSYPLVADLLDFGEEKSSSEKVVSLYPNMATDYVNVDINKGTSEVEYLAIYDITGREVKRFRPENVSTTNGFRLPLEDIAAGMYVVIIQDRKNGLIRKKLGVRK